MRLLLVERNASQLWMRCVLRCFRAINSIESREVRSLWQGGSRRGRTVPTLRRTTRGGGASGMAARVGRVGASSPSRHS
jgi:hypothetical protein